MKGGVLPEVYQRLARRLNQLPQGFPATPDGIELEILRRIFSPQDAAVALRLRPWPESPAQVSRRLRRPEGEVRSILEGMAGRGQIYSTLDEGIQKYGLAPFVVGIYEFQVDHLDEELARLFEAYYPYFAEGAWKRGPALARVLPVRASVRADLSILSYEDLEQRIEEAKSFVIRDCICRKERGLTGHSCSHPLETCLQLSRQKGAFDNFTYAGRVIDRREALEILARTEEEGLVHSTYNFRDDPVFICNCCSCCCGFLRGIRDFEAPFMLARSDFVAAVQEEKCTGCGKCSGGRCPMDAIQLINGFSRIVPEQCIGCGVCCSVCSKQALTMVRRPAAERRGPERDMVDWGLGRYGERGGALVRTGVKLIRRIRNGRMNSPGTGSNH